MDRGTYSAASGGLFQFRKLEVVNNNLANTNTPGFKKQLLVGSEQTFDQTLASAMQGMDAYASGDHRRTPGVVNIKTVTDFSAGPIKNTGNPLDAALRDEHDFFAIQTPEGEQYTRAGNFTLDSEGTLVTMDGLPVMGDGGPLVAQGAGVSLGNDGSLRAGGAAVGKVKVVHFDDPSALERVGATRFKLGANQPAPAPSENQIEAQSLEMSNALNVNSILDLITTNRAFDMYTKSARSIDEMNQQAISQIGRRR